MSKIIKIVMCLCIMLLSLQILGCNDGSEVKRNVSQAYSVVDARGKKIDFAKPPSRIMSVYPGSDEILVNLIPTNRILALSQWAEDKEISNIMEYAPQVKLRTEYNVENILKHNPDLVFLRMGTSADFIEALETVGVKVFIYKQPNSIQEALEVQTTFGKVLQAEARAEELNAQITAAMDKLVREHQHEKEMQVLIFNSRGAMSSKGGLLDDFLKLAGLHNAANDYDIPAGTVLSKEQVVAVDPDAFILIDWCDGGYFATGEQKLKEVYGDPSYNELKAIVNQRVILLPIKYITCNSVYMAPACEKIMEIIK